MHFKDIEINNFRGFDHLKIEDFGQINLFVGKNNSGKTSVLEALYLSSGLKSSFLYLIENYRGQIDLDFQGVFHNLEFENYPAIISHFDTQSERKIEITPMIESEISKDVISTISPISIRKVKINYVIDGQKRTSTTSQDRHHGYWYTGENIYCVFIHTQTSAQGTLSLTEELIKKKRKNVLLEVLQKVDSKIFDFQIIGSEIFFDIKNVENLLPSHVIGDGLKKIMFVLSSALVFDNAIILIDEIENGLHYTAHKTLWRGIIEACRMTNAQIFATTHSLESLKCLNEVLQENEYIDFQEKVRCYDLVKTKQKGFQAYKYNYEGFSHALEMETEIR